MTIKEILQIILIPFFSLTLISCADVLETSNSSAGSTARSASDTDVTSSCPGCKVLYIDKKSLSKYKTNNYLLLDPFEGHRQNGLITEDFEFYHESSTFPDLIFPRMTLRFTLAVTRV